MNTMENIKNNFVLENFIKENYSHKTANTHDICQILPVITNNKMKFNISNNIGSIVIDGMTPELILNPILVFELDENNGNNGNNENNGYNDELDIDSIISNIYLEIGGSTIFKLWDQQIKIYNKIYKLESKKIGSKIFYPVPILQMINGNGLLFSKCKYHEIRLFVNYNANHFLKYIKHCYMTCDLIYVYENPNYSLLTNYTFTNFKNNNQCRNNLNNFNKLNEIYQNSILLKINENQFTGLEFVDQNSSTLRTRLNFNHNVNRFFIYFQNQDDKSIYWNTQQFEKIQFFALGETVLEYDYQTLLDLNDKNILGYELPNGVFEIKWNCAQWKNLSNLDNLTIVISKLMIPLNFGFAICAESENLACYKGNAYWLFFAN